MGSFEAPDLSYGALAPLLIVLGVYPQPLLTLIEPAVSATMSDLGGADR